MLMCALLGFAYMSQISNTKSTYETMDENELVRLLNESNTQISNLEQRKSQLTSQLNSLKSAANEQEQARKIAKQNEETSGLISGRLPSQGQGYYGYGQPRFDIQNRRFDHVQPSSRSCAMPAPKSLPSTRFALSHRPIFKMLTKG